MIEQRNQPAVIVTNVSKKHRLFENARDRLKEALHPFSKRYHREFWALQDINFEIPRGQTVGILGRNGSGKSTLLQILASVMQPTSGVVTVDGRVSALLELGAGFNPEFTGRENSVFQAEVVGLSREEIDRKLSEIESFADIGTFFDQPTKVYSSGMFVRVAFAAAINVDPDVLIIDEALAVGDAKFQNKCFQKLREFREQGKTILLVTHAMETVTRLCDQAILLEHGRIVKMGSPNDVTNTYFDLLFGNAGKPKLLKVIGSHNVVGYLGTYYAVPQVLGEIDFHAADLANLDGVIVGKTIEELEACLRKETSAVLAVADITHNQKCDLEVFLDEVLPFDNCSNRRSYNKNESRTGDGRAEIVDYICVRDDDADVLEVKTWDTLKIYMKILFRQPIQFPVYGMSIKSVDGVKVYGTNTWLDKVSVPSTSEGEIVIFFYELKVSLAGGDFFVSLAIAERINNQYVLADHRTDLLHIRVQTAKEGMNGLVEMETKSEIFSQTALTKRWASA